MTKKNITTKEIKLGSKVKCKITGVKGIATCRTEFLNGCIQYEVQPPVDKEGKIVESVCIDVQSLEVLKKKKPTVKKSPTGGAMKKSKTMRGF